MRAPLVTLPRLGGRPSARNPIEVSHARTLTVTWWREQPGAPSPGGLEPAGTLAVVSASLSDDGARPVQRQMTVELAAVPVELQVGMWIQSTLGIKLLAPDMYRLPNLMITAIDRKLDRQGGATLHAEDPATVLNGRPYEADTTLTGTLRTLVKAACDLSLRRETNVDAVPDIALPGESLAEFGSGRWDTCLKMADALGVQLRFTDDGDVKGFLRSAPAPAPAATVTQVIVPPGGTHHSTRTPTSAVVLVTRGGTVAPLTGRAAASAVPAHYLSYVVVDRKEGDPMTTQAQADALAAAFLTTRLSDFDRYTDMSILPAPWLEAGEDTVEFDGAPYWVRAIQFELPALTTSITLRSVTT